MKLQGISLRDESGWLIVNARIDDVDYDIIQEPWGSLADGGSIYTSVTESGIKSITAGRAV